MLGRFLSVAEVWTCRGNCRDVKDKQEEAACLQADERMFEMPREGCLKYEGCKGVTLGYAGTVPVFTS